MYYACLKLISILIYNSTMFFFEKVERSSCYIFFFVWNTWIPKPLLSRRLQRPAAPFWLQSADFSILNALSWVSLIVANTCVMCFFCVLFLKKQKYIYIHHLYTKKVHCCSNFCLVQWLKKQEKRPRRWQHLLLPVRPTNGSKDIFLAVSFFIIYLVIT